MTIADRKTHIRSHMCGVLNPSMEGVEVTLCGWIKKTRDHGNLIFLDISDISGTSQIYSNENSVIEQVSKFRLEDVVQIRGIVKKRPADMVNSDMVTGEIEIECKEAKLLSKSEVPPFVVEEDVKASEDLRLKYRYLDLRRRKMQDIMIKRAKTYSAVREYLNKNGFIEIETPIMSKSTPEGARDYLVPSRVHKGNFYALVQSPQLYKQILMISGFDRYFQFARCFRDEDLRADRQPEHTQIDLEMSFVSKEDIFLIIEGMMKHVFQDVIQIELNTPFPIITYNEAMENYGSDKPDVRFENLIIDITELAKESDSNILNNNEYTGALFFEELFTRKEIDSVTDFIKSAGAAGMGYIKINENTQSGSFAKYINLEHKANTNGIFFIMSGPKKRTLQFLGMLRKHIAEVKNLVKGNEFKFLWVTDFPLFEYNENENRYEPCHHMFTMPKQEFVGKMKENPLAVKGELYDLVCNGIELASGSIRIHRLEIQREIMELIGLSDDELEAKFGFLLEAFKYGAPPHGGIAPGMDRLIMLMTGHDNIRDVIAFPKTLNAVGLMEHCPSEVSIEQMEELGIKLKEGGK